MITVLKKSRSVGTSLLLAGALLCGGLKSPLAFSVWALVALTWAILLTHEGVPDRRRTGFFLAFNAGVMLSQIYSLDPSNSFYWTVQSLVLASLWLALQTVPPFPDEKVLWKMLQGLGVLTVLVTCLQMLHGSSPYGFLPLNPNFNAIWMAALAGAFLTKAKRTPLEKGLCLGFVLLIVIGRSRSGLVGLFAAVVYALTQNRRSGTLLWGLGISGLAALVIPHSWWLHRLNWTENGARLRIWGVALKALAERPLTGYGLGNFELAYLRYAFPVEGAVRYGHTTAFAHNDYLQALSEWGWPTAGLLMLGFFSVLMSKRTDRPLAVMAKTILVVLSAAAFFNPIFKMPAFIFLAILASACLTQRPPQGPLGSPPIEKRTLSCLRLYIVLLGLATVWCGLRGHWAGQDRWEEIARWDHKDAEAWHELANQTPDHFHALYFHQYAVQESPYQPYYVEALARALEISGEKEHRKDALAAYFAALELSPTRAVNDLAIARLLWRGGEPESAGIFAQRALALEPHYWEAMLWKARALKALGRTAEAMITLIQLQRQHQEFEQTPHMAPQSPYEEAILGYSEAVVQKEIAHAR